MASTYVNDLRLNEMATGDESGNWGVITNTNLELIAEAFSYGTEAITTNADTHTTTIADGATDPGRSMYLKYTGTLDSACTITIGPNTVSKVWIIENGTSGSQNIIISQGSGANITIPAGDTKVVYSDGAGAGAAFVDAFASLSVVDLKVQDDLTVTDAALVTGVLTTTATQVATGGITSGSDIISDTDSTDSLGSTGVRWLKGWFDTLTAGTLTVGSGSVTDSSGAISFGDENLTTTGIVTAAGTSVFTNLDISGDIDVDGTTNLDVVDIDGALTQDGGAVFNEASADVDFRVESDNDANALFVQGSDGFVGIGTASPTEKLSVLGGHVSVGDTTGVGGTEFLLEGYREVSGGTKYGNTSIRTTYDINSNASDMLFYTASGGTNTDERLRIDASGSVGIGVVPSSWAANTLDALQLGASIGVGNLTARVDGINAVGLGLNWYYGGGATNTYVATSFATNYSQEAGTHRWFHAASGSAGAALTFTESMRIDASGNLLVGTTSNSRGGRAVIEGTTGDTLRLNGGQSGYMGLYITSSTSDNHIYCDNTGTAQFYVVRSNGNYYFEGSAISDRDLKENITSVPDGSLDLIKSLTPRTYNFKSEENFSTEIKTGFIAQEVAEVIIEGRVATGTDGQKDMAVDTIGIVAHLVKAIQEQQTIIESLEARITALES
jgi:hypothetical protein